MRAVATVDTHDRRLVPTAAGIGGRTAEGLGPAGGEPLAVSRMKSVAKRVADYLVGYHPGVPRLGQPEQATLRSLAISLLRLDGHSNIAAANRHHARDPQRTLKLLQTA
jgi:hypothetical protein